MPCWAADSSKATATAAAGGSPRKQSVGSSWSAQGWDNVKAPGMTAVIPGVMLLGRVAPLFHMQLYIIAYITAILRVKALAKY